MSCCYNQLLYLLQSVRAELVEKEELDTTGLESGDQESLFLSARGTKAVCKQLIIVPLVICTLDLIAQIK